MLCLLVLYHCAYYVHSYRTWERTDIGKSRMTVARDKLRFHASFEGLVGFSIIPRVFLPDHRSFLL